MPDLWPVHRQDSDPGGDGMSDPKTDLAVQSGSDVDNDETSDSERKADTASNVTGGEITGGEMGINLKSLARPMEFNSDSLIQIDPRTGRQFTGLLFIGDPHLEGRVPGFRKDSYPLVVLNKVRWCLNYARDNDLVPVFLGDMFQVPRDNPNWLIVELMELIRDSVFGIYGNHDVRENHLDENDSISILIESGRYRLLDGNQPQRLMISDREVLLGGTSWGNPLPEKYDHFSLGAGGQSLCFWVTHHDIRIEGQYESGDVQPAELPGIDAVINGHIHRRLEPVTLGQTSWLTPGNISRRKRCDMNREKAPGVLRVDIDHKGWSYRYITVDHRPFDEVFHAAVEDLSDEQQESAFVEGLAQMEGLKTETGEGLHEFLEKNLGQFSTEVADEIRNLAMEVTN